MKSACRTCCQLSIDREGEGSQRHLPSSFKPVFLTSKSCCYCFVAQHVSIKATTLGCSDPGRLAGVCQAPGWLRLQPKVMVSVFGGLLAANLWIC